MQSGNVNDNPFDFDLWTDGTTEAKTMQDVKLKPCPFCGGEAKTGRIFGHETVYCTQCDACILPSPYNSFANTDKELEEAIEAWNRRAEKVAVRYRADKENGKYVCSECGHNVIWNPNREDELMMWHPYCNTCGARILRIENYGEPKQEV